MTANQQLPAVFSRDRFCNVATASGGRGRIRTFVARKERQIYSLLVLATHPPVPEKSSGMPSCIPQSLAERQSRVTSRDGHLSLISSCLIPQPRHARRKLQKHK